MYLFIVSLFQVNKCNKNKRLYLLLENMRKIFNFLTIFNFILLEITTFLTIFKAYASVFFGEF